MKPPPEVVLAQKCQARCDTEKTRLANQLIRRTLEAWWKRYGGPRVHSIEYVNGMGLCYFAILTTKRVWTVNGFDRPGNEHSGADVCQAKSKQTWNTVYGTDSVKHRDCFMVLARCLTWLDDIDENGIGYELRLSHK